MSVSYLELKEKIFNLLPGIKPNLHNYPIINKWNWRIYQKHKFEVFSAIEDEIEEILKQKISETFDDFTNI